MPAGKHGRGYRDAQATPQHNGCGSNGYEVRPDDALILRAIPTIGLGDRCRWYRGILPPSEASANVRPLTWHAAITNPGREGYVRQQLQERGIDTVMPMVRFWRIRHRVRDVAERPLIARCVIFGIDSETQALVEPDDRYELIGDQYVKQVDGPCRVRPVLGLERIVRGASDQWAVLPTEEVYELRLSVLRGDFDGTLREGKGNLTRKIPTIIQWLLDRGELQRDAVLTHKEAKTKGLSFSVAA